MAETKIRRSTAAERASKGLRPLFVPLDEKLYNALQAESFALTQETGRRVPMTEIVRELLEKRLAKRLAEAA